MTVSVGLRDRLLRLIGRAPVQQDGQPRHRGPATHVIILDGTMSSLQDGCETNAGLLFKLLRDVGQSANLTVHYEAGLQWRDWGQTWDVATGRGINRQIRRAYGVLASRYREGDRIMLAGYSRGAYAVRSLAGMIDSVGLVQANAANVRVIRTAYRHYRAGATSSHADAFRRRYCHWSVEIEAVGVWDTVKSLGLRLPVLWRWADRTHAFHNHALGRTIRHGFHALARDETREAYRPILWTSRPGSRIEQVWFRGTHADIGGQLNGRTASRPLANIPLVWMLERLEMCDLPLPAGWRDRFPCDPEAPSVGPWAGWAKLFLLRRARVVGQDPSERLHDSLTNDGQAVPAP